MRALVLLGLVALASALQSPLSCTGPRRRSAMAAGKGFGNVADGPKPKAPKKKKPGPVTSPADVLIKSEAPPIAEAAEVKVSSEADASARQKDIFAKYGVQSAEEKLRAPEPEPEPSVELIKLIPPSVQIGLEKVLIAGIVSMLIVFVTIGFAITYEAFAVSSNQPLPEDQRHIIVDIMEPAFTPSLIAGFACSISLGGLKALQLSSSDVQYSEND